MSLWIKAGEFFGAVLDELAKKAGEEVDKRSKIKSLLREAHSFCNLKQFDKALLHCDEAIVIARSEKARGIVRSDYNPWLTRSHILNQSGRHEESLKTIDEVLQLQPDLPEALYNKACAYVLMGQATSVLEHLKKATKIDPSLLKVAKTDSDFDAVRNDPRFRPYV